MGLTEDANLHRWFTAGKTTFCAGCKAAPDSTEAGTRCALPEWQDAETLAQLVKTRDEALEEVRAAKRRTNDFVAEHCNTGHSGDPHHAMRAYSRYAKDRDFTFAMVEELPRVVELLAQLGGLWRHNNFGFQFKFPNGSLLAWWPQSGKVLWQGKLPRGRLSDLSVVAALESFAGKSDRSLGASW